MLVPQINAEGVPHRLLEAILEIFVLLAGLGRFGRMLTAVLHGYGGSGIAFERLLDGLWRIVGRSWRGFGCHVGAPSGSEIWKLSETVAPRGRRFQSGSLTDFVSKISSLGDHKVCI